LFAPDGAPTKIFEEGLQRMSETVLLIHGIWMRSPTMWMIAKKLRERGFQTRQFNYGSVFSTPAASMERLAMQLYAMNDKTVHLVGHSLGGLIAVETLNRYQDLPNGRIVCLGSPLQGSSTARALAEKKMPYITGKSGNLLRGGLIHLPKNRQVGMIAGAKGRGVGRLLTRFEGEHDGTVSVWETRLPGLREHLVLPLSHSGLVISEKVGAYTANFLETGFFQIN
jgi:pimeloyl-ACP methyl ester carboxylesterase